MSDCTTRGVRIQVAPAFHPERSDPGRQQWFFSYTVTVSNVGAAPVRLVSRHWIITDGSGHVEHVRGPGVVGEQPRLEPGASFEYTSFCHLPTPFGGMHGSYGMVRDDGERFDAQIDPFVLEDPSQVN
ncbi:MAG: Co2+/Mg2+ efflux protein ApaG [Deltaproteobacteria bacterium]|nr:Co2+/Mg2+ efflux protein ApaG [Deltaproteobacteria bacterium]